MKTKKFNDIAIKSCENGVLLLAEGYVKDSPWKQYVFESIESLCEFLEDKIVDDTGLDPEDFKTRERTPMGKAVDKLVNDGINNLSIKS